MLTVAATILLAATAPASVLDKTLVCSTEHGDVDVIASPRGDRAYATARTTSSGYLGLNTGSIGGRANLVHVRARLEKSAISNVASQPQGVYAGAGRCFLSRKSVPLSSRGLVGPPVEWAKDYTCTVRGRLVVRVRAEIPSSSGWRRIDDDFFGVRTNVTNASLAVRSERTGKPLAFSSLDSAGKTKLWVANRCS
jgi:hypothetical protein